MAARGRESERLRAARKRRESCVRLRAAIEREREREIERRGRESERLRAASLRLREIERRPAREREIER
jgi:hypothetical protein